MRLRAIVFLFGALPGSVLAYLSAALGYFAIVHDQERWKIAWSFAGLLGYLAFWTVVVGPRPTRLPVTARVVVSIMFIVGTRASNSLYEAIAA